MTHKTKNANAQGAKAKSAKSAKSAKESTKQIIAAEISKTKHIIENRAKLSTKQLKAIRTKRRNEIKRFVSEFFVANQKKDAETLKAIKSNFVAFIKNNYSLDAMKCTASELYNAKDAKLITDISEILNFVRK